MEISPKQYGSNCAEVDFYTIVNIQKNKIIEYNRSKLSIVIIMNVF